MKRKIFVSYASEDDDKLKAFCKAIAKEEGRFETIIIANRRNPGTPLTEKVKKDIEEADCFIPIITRTSIVNQ